MGELDKLALATRIVGETQPKVEPEQGKEPSSYKARGASDEVVGADAQRRSDQGRGRGNSKPAPCTDQGDEQLLHCRGDVTSAQRLCPSAASAAAALVGCMGLLGGDTTVVVDQARAACEGFSSRGCLCSRLVACIDKMACLILPLEPASMHRSKKLVCDGPSRRRTDNRVNRALRTERRLTIIDPLNDLGRLEHRRAVEAAAQVAAQDHVAVTTRALVCEPGVEGHGQANVFGAQPRAPLGALAGS